MFFFSSDWYKSKWFGAEWFKNRRIPEHYRELFALDHTGEFLHFFEEHFLARSTRARNKLAYAPLQTSNYNEQSFADTKSLARYLVIHSWFFIFFITKKKSFKHKSYEGRAIQSTSSSHYITKKYAVTSEVTPSLLSHSSKSSKCFNEFSNL